MIMKYAYAWIPPMGVYYVGLPSGTVTFSMSPEVMASYARAEGSPLGEVRRQAAAQLGSHDFKLENVTPEHILRDGLQSGDDIAKLYELVRWDLPANRNMGDKYGNRNDSSRT